ncbi:MAG: hypothetical protein IK149_06685 [Oscillospiraceae bacterium]|nr:hypothetical protein [Oscillospiraceae bacterium]
MRSFWPWFFIRKNGIWIVLALMGFFLLFLALFRLPYFRDGALTEVHGRLTDVGTEQSPAWKGWRKWIVFDLNGQPCYFSITDAAKTMDQEALIKEFCDCESEGTDVGALIISEPDYRDFWLGKERSHVVRLDLPLCESALENYQGSVRLVRVVLIASAVALLSIVSFFLIQEIRDFRRSHRKMKKKSTVSRSRSAGQGP